MRRGHRSQAPGDVGARHGAVFQQSWAAGFQRKVGSLHPVSSVLLPCALLVTERRVHQRPPNTLLNGVDKTPAGLVPQMLAEDAADSTRVGQGARDR